LQVNFKFTKRHLFEDPDLSEDGSYTLKCAVKHGMGKCAVVHLVYNVYYWWVL
jgi:hypothetical protein